MRCICDTSSFQMQNSSSIISF
uniref:Uncharacterized protein n=1 Tax=Anguilla anguilla TaxID=7936 RepID=A0A0E9RJ48_ANGAN